MQISSHLLARGALAVLVAIALVTGVACSSNSPDDDQAQPNPDPTVETPDPSETGGSLTFALDAVPLDLNPLTHQWSAAEEEVARTALETLATYNRYHQPMPDLAESITPDATQTTWTIALRPGITLHNGTALDAQLVRDGLELMRASPAHAATLAPIVSVEATSDLDVVVTAAEPWPLFPHLLTTQIGVVADPDWLSTGDGMAPVGTGPFQVALWAPHERVVVQRSGGHWRYDHPEHPPLLLDEITFVPVLDEGARFARLNAGRIDVSTTSDPFEIHLARDLADAGDIQFFERPPALGMTTALRLRTDAPPFDEPLARQALTLATDTAGLVRAIYSEIDSDLVEAPQRPSATFDVDEAAQLASGLATLSGSPLSFSLLVPNDPRLLAMGDALREQWAAAGIQAHLIVADPAVLAARMALGDDQAALVEQPARPGESFVGLPAGAGAHIELPLHRAPIAYLATETARPLTTFLSSLSRGI